MALADAHGCADMGDSDDTGTADARAESGSTAASRVEAERLRWNPTLGDDAVPLVGEWKYPLDKPHGPVVCTSRRVNCIAPGLIKTDFAKALWDNPDTLKRSLSGTPLKRIGEPEEIAGAAVYLASKAGAYMTGQMMVVDGGATST